MKNLSLKYLKKSYPKIPKNIEKSFSNMSKIISHPKIYKRNSALKYLNWLVTIQFRYFRVHKNGGIISLWCELFIIIIFVLLIVLSFISDIFYPDDDICKYWKLDFTMTIYVPF